MSKLQAFKNRKNQWGLRRCLYWELMNILRIAFGFQIHYLNIGNSIHDSFDENLCDPPDGYKTRKLDPQELLAWVDSVPELVPEILQTAIANGDMCFANFFEERLVGFDFISRTRTVVSDQLDILIPEGFRYGYKGWTHPDHRQSGLARMRARAMLESADRPYHERLIWYVETHNYSSLLHRYKPPREHNLRVGFIGWFSFFGKQLPFNSRNAKRYGVEFVRKEDSGNRQYI